MAIFSKLTKLGASFLIATAFLALNAEAQVLPVVPDSPVNIAASGSIKKNCTADTVAVGSQAISILPKQITGTKTATKSRLANQIKESMGLPADIIEACLSRLEQNKKCEIEEITRCYERMSKAIDNSASEKVENLSMLCWHLLLDLSDPSQINQGNHNTCALASLQSYLSIRHPFIVCNVVLDAWNDSLTLPGGRHIIIGEKDLAPDREARFFRPGAHYRSYSSQVFQIAAANIYWQAQSTDPRGTKVPVGSIRYVQNCFDMPNNSKDTGESLLICWADNIVEQVVSDDSLFPASGPCFTMEAINGAYKLITQMNDAPLLLAHKSRRCHKPVISFSDEASLKNILTELKASGQLPAIISLNMSSEVLNPKKGMLVVKDNKLLYASVQSNSPNQWHVLCVSDFDALRDGIALDNFWGPGSDYLDKHLSLHELWSSSFALNNGRIQIGAARLAHQHAQK